MPGRHFFTESFIASTSAAKEDQFLTVGIRNAAQSCSFKETYHFFVLSIVVWFVFQLLTFGEDFADVRYVSLTMKSRAKINKTEGAVTPLLLWTPFSEVL